MAAFRRLLGLAFVCLASLSAAELADQVVAERILGPHWSEISRSAGMVFAGTVLSVETQPVGQGRPLPLILTKFRVDRAIAGVQPGQVLIAREWAGAWSMHHAMRSGQRVLIFLYPPSRLGLTSPVGGPLGQVALDSRGEIVQASVSAPDTRSGLPPPETTKIVDAATSGAKAQFQNRLNAALKRCSTQSQSVSENCEAGLDSAAFAARLKSCPPQNLPVAGVFPQERKDSANQASTVPAGCTAAKQPSITMRQLERAIRSARKR